MRHASITIRCATLGLLLGSSASVQLYTGYSVGESYFEDRETGTVTLLSRFGQFEVYAAAADDEDEVLWLSAPNPANGLTSSLFR
ncbi:MAG: hypothetical protein AAF957_26830 [Planctomycetota bacterium]